MPLLHLQIQPTPRHWHLNRYYGKIQVIFIRYVGLIIVMLVRLNHGGFAQGGGTFGGYEN
jgi:hypothetical protein